VGSRTWTLVGGVLPPGLELLSNGTLIGTPTAPAREELTVRVADSTSTVQRNFFLEVAPLGGFSNDADLVLHYTFDEGAGSRIWDIARAGNDHSTTVSGVFWSATGRMEKSFGSGGTDNVVRDFFPANQSDLNFDPRVDQFTIATWVRSSSSGIRRVIFTTDSDGEASARDQFKLIMLENGSSLQLNSAGGILLSANLTAGANVVGTEWHHLAFVNISTGSGMRTRIYRNGQLLGEFQPGSTPPGTHLMRIGSSTHGSPWSGGLDDFRVYKRALTVAELNGLQQSGAAVDLSGLSHVYNATPRSVGVETNPLGLQFSVTYNGSATAPSNAGNYTVNATITQPGYSGSATGTLTIARKGLTISGLSGANKSFDGSVSASVTGTATLVGVEP
ncbi:MAG: MBG domain-containing protein, partial [Spartobacteria bacterium]